MAATSLTPSSWRSSAAKVVEELFPASPANTWDQLLDLRAALLHHSSCEEILENFATCRQRLEEDHYLPFYRLRRLLAAHLRLEGENPLTLHTLLRQKNFSYRRWRKDRGSQRLVELA